MTEKQSQTHDPLVLYVLFVLLIIFFLPVFLFAYSTFREHLRDSGRYSSGLAGEHGIAEELKRVLGPDYTVFQDVYIKFGNIDFVVLGPTGLFVIEVKNHRGKIAFNGKQLTKNDIPFEKDILKQSMSEALSLHELLEEKLEVYIFVQPVIVFANYTDIHFGFKPVNNVYVIRKAGIKEFIESRPPCNYPIERSLIEKELISLCCSN